MEYTIGEYKRSNGKIFSSADGFKYLSCKVIGNQTYLRCALFKDKCKGTAKLDQERNLIFPKGPHNHPVQDYRSYFHVEVKTKCKKIAQTSGSNLRELFDSTTRSDPSASDVSFKECESAMFRSRRKLQPKIPRTASELCEMLPTTGFENNLKAIVTQNNGIGVIFFSDEVEKIGSDISEIQFDGTFHTVPDQFYQLWTIFFSVGRHTLPAIHCLLTNKEEELYSAVLHKIKLIIPQFQPTHAMSDWEQAARNAFKQVYPGSKMNGCWFHYTQAVWRRTQKAGLVQSFRENPQVSSFLRYIMAIPFLPPDLIHPTFSQLQIPTLTNDDRPKLDQTIKYFKKQWLTRIAPEELSIFDLTKGTNNGAESYLRQLKSRIKCGHPRIWNFLKVLDDLIADNDNEFARLQQGRETTRPRKKKDIANDERRALCKQKLKSRDYTPLQFLKSISHTLGHVTEEKEDDISDFSDCPDSDHEIETNNSNLICVVCIQIRHTTWIFLPCRHANCCGECSSMIEQLDQRCPTCRTPIESRLQIYLN